MAADPVEQCPPPDFGSDGARERMRKNITKPIETAAFYGRTPSDTALGSHVTKPPPLLGRAGALRACAQQPPNLGAGSFGAANRIPIRLQLAGGPEPSRHNSGTSCHTAARRAWYFWNVWYVSMLGSLRI